ncbi:MAG: hypothetical protein WAM91_11185 [Candidatus Acidiferrales bacterium]
MAYKKIVLSTLMACLLGQGSFPTEVQDVRIQNQKIEFLDLYYPILDIVFPKPPEIPFDALFMSSLRFIPSDAPESQINIVRDFDGYFSVVEYFQPPDSRPIMWRLSDLYHADKLDTYDPAELAKRFKVEVRTVNIPTKVMLDLFDKLNQLHFPSERVEPRSVNMVFDGLELGLWYKSSLGELTFKYQYARTGKEKGSARQVAEWMNRVKKSVDSVK